MGFGNWVLRVVLVIVVFSFQSFAIETEHVGRIKFKDEPWRLVCKEAQEKEKLIFVYVFADYCSTCHRMDYHFKNTKLGELYNSKFVSVRFDAKDLIQHQRATSWGVSSVPSLVYLNEKKDVVHIVSGFRDADGLLREAQIALAKAGKDYNLEETK